MSSTGGIDTADRRKSIKSCLTGSRLTIIAAISFMVLFGLGLSDYLSASPDGEFLQIDFNMSFRDVPCKFTSVHVRDAFGRNMLNVTKTVHTYPIDPQTQEIVEEHADGSLVLNSSDLNTILLQYPLLKIMSFAPFTPWSHLPKSAYVGAAKIMRERYGTETGNYTLQKSHNGDRDAESLLKMMEHLIAPSSLKCSYYWDSQRTSESIKRGCRIEGSVRAKKVTRYLTASTRSSIDGARARVYIVFKTRTGKKFLDH